MNLLYDARWPVGTGIRRVADLYLDFAPAHVKLEQLVNGVPIGSPFSSIGLSGAIFRQRQKVPGELFWNPGYVPPLPGITKSVVMVHDLIHLHFYTRAHRLFFDFIYKPLYRRCDHIICISEHTRQEFLAWSGMSDDKVSVVPNAIAPSFASSSDALRVERPFIFYAGNRRSYKNVPMLVKAFSASGLAQQGFDLVLSGNVDPALQAIAKDGNSDDALKFAGVLSDEELVSYYKAARCVAYLSRYEGFGLPILEAMECDTPLLLMHATSLPEVAGDAALYVYENEVGEISEALKKICLDEGLRKELVDKGRIRRQLYSAEASSTKLWSLLQAVADR